jgi:AcrR family transcriptional regulator
MSSFFSMNPKEQAMLEASKKLFFEKGFEATCMDEIAHLAKVSKATLYSYFPNKCELYKKIVEIMCHNLIHDLEGVLEKEHDFSEALLSFGRTFLKAVLSEDGLDLYRLIISGSKKFADLNQEFYKWGIARATALLLQFFEKEHILKHLSPKDAVEIFLSLLIGGIQARVVLGILPATDEVIEPWLKRAVLNFLRLV